MRGRTMISGVASLVILGSVGLAFHENKSLALLDPLEVMTYNIGDLNTPRPSVEDVAKVIKRHGVPDLLMIQEVTGEKATSRLSGILDLPHFLYSSYKGKKSGVAIHRLHGLHGLEKLNER